MNYYSRKRRSTLAVLDLMAMLAPWVVLMVIVAVLAHACGTAIDKQQQRYELPAKDRAAVAASWTAEGGSDVLR
jgi:uncharacterized lipoprotein YmbA